MATRRKSHENVEQVIECASMQCRTSKAAMMSTEVSIVAVFVFLVSASYCWSNEKHQNQSSSDHRSGTGQSHQTKSPFTIIVQPAPVKIIQEAAPAEKKQPIQKWYQRPSATDWGILAVTTVYTVISLGLFYATQRQANLAKVAAEAASANAEAANRQAGIANRTLLLQFRPRLIIRNVVIQEMTILGERHQILARNFPIVGQFYIANVGDSTATIKEILSMVFWESNPLPMQRPYEGQDGLCPVKSIQLKPGESAPWVFDSIRPLDVNSVDILRFQNIGQPPRVNLYIMGWVEYSDDLGFVRRTAFCRRLDPQSVRFVKIDDPDYEHEE